MADIDKVKAGAYKSISIGVHKDFLIYFGESMNSYEPVFVVCIGEPQERVHRNKIIIFIIIIKNFKIFRIHE